MVDVGDIIRKIRRSKHMTQHQLALKSGTPQNVISKIELNRFPEVPPETLMKIADGLDIPNSDLLHLEVKDNINDLKPKASEGVSVGIEFNIAPMIARVALEESVREYLRRTHRRNITDEELHQFLSTSSPEAITKAQNDFKLLPTYNPRDDQK